MVNKRPTRDVRGLLLLDKPRGMSSNGALQHAKRLFQAAKAGHTGSLDPLATGMLPICFGAATKLSGYLLDAPKTYAVTAELGAATNTGDAEGDIVQRDAVPARDDAQVRTALAALEGEIEQVPPMHSALKRNGVPLYRLARRGVEVPRAARAVTVHSIRLDSYHWPELRFTVSCSKGTYVRTLVTDLAAALGTLGHVRELRRLSVATFREEQMRTFEALEALLREDGLAALDTALMPLDSALGDWPKIVLDADRAARLLHGESVTADSDSACGWTRVYVASGELIALGEVLPDGRLAPRRVFGPQAAGPQE
jgi:tRNA pseudouridine55 synthase